jgi:hypothetical protein
MKHMNMKKLGYEFAVVLGVSAMLALPVSAAAVSTSAAATAKQTAASANAAAAAAKVATANQARLQRIIARGNLEIGRRLTTLGTLSSKIASATKLSSADAATLNGTVTSDTSSLSALKTQLDGDTTVTTAITDAQSIITGYRVYALVVPQVDLVKTADDQQVAEGNLGTLSTKLSARITAEQQKGTNVTALQATLADLNTQTANAQTISSSIETSVIALVPSDYNSNHTVLAGDHTQLVTAQGDIQKAISDGKSIVSQLSSS